MADLTQFDLRSAARIVRAVQSVEGSSPPAKPLVFDRVEARPAVLRLATFTGNWQAGAYKTVTLYGSTQTASVLNLCDSAIGFGAAQAACSRYVIFGKSSGTSLAVEIQLQSECQTCHMTIGSFDLTQLPGYSTASIQLLGHNTTGPCLQWYSITTCSTATAA